MKINLHYYNYLKYYDFDSNGEGCTFNKKKEVADKNIMLDLLGKLISRLNELNDGSFEIEDRLMLFKKCHIYKL